jgi:PAS domain S-box-containing protein
MLKTRSSRIGICLNLTRAISRARGVEEIYEIALDALQDGLGVSRSSVLLFDPDGVMRFKAHRRLSETYRQAVEGHTPWTPDSPDPEPIVVGDVKNDPSLAPYLPAIQAEGIAAMTFVPLVSLGRVIGKFMLYYDAPYTLDHDELQLAGVIASQVAFAVERARSAEQARRSEERLRFALSAANMGIWDWDLGTQAVRWSENLHRIHGLSGGFDGTFQGYVREIHAEDRDGVLTSIERALAEGVPHDVEYRIVGPEGSVRWVECKGRIERGPDGSPVRMTGVCRDVTDRKEAELAGVQALEESHRASQRLAAIVESSGDAIVSKNLDGVITSWNHAAEHMFGYSASEAIGRSITLIIPHDRLAEEELVLSRIRAGELVEMETLRRHKDGTIVPISLMVSPIKDRHGNIVGASKIARDISARLRIEAERAELHRRLRTLVSASASLLDSPETESVLSATIALAQQLLAADGHAVWEIDSARNTWRALKSEGISAAFAGRMIASDRHAGVPAWQLLSSPLVVPDVYAHPLLESQALAYRQEGIRSILVCPLRLGLEGAATLAFYYRTPRDFSEIDVEAGRALANLAGAAMTTADLHGQLRTQRNAAETARRQASFLADSTAVLSQSLDSEQTLAAIARLALPEIADLCAVHIVDHDGHLQQVAVAHVDPAKVELVRTLNEEYQPNPKAPGGIHEVVRTGQPAMLATIPAELLSAHIRDERHRRILSELALTSCMCVPLVSARGTLGAMTFVYAESGRHYTERDLAFAQELAARATLAIENAFAYRRVNEANRLKDEFLATLSHELRTPLNAILGYAQMLNVGVLGEERQSNAMTVLLRNAESLKQIIEDVLDVSRITSGKLRLKMRPVELAGILNNAVATVQPAADAKGVALQTVIDARTPAVSGDPDRLQQIFWNLLSNAVKFTPRGGHVQLRLEPVESSVQVVVSDDGQGIDAEFLPHIFERFRQADSRFSREHGGLGLGLAIVRELAELHGGTVLAASQGPGKGATFTVKLPPLLAPSAQPPSELHSVVQAGQPYERLERLSGVHILAVDNEEDALGLLRVILESEGAQVTTAASAQQALERLKSAAFDAVIADLGMPGMDGLELIRHIRRTLPPPANRLPAVALTAYARSDHRITALASGFQMHLPKPVNPHELVIAVAALVGR